MNEYLPMFDNYILKDEYIKDIEKLLIDLPFKLHFIDNQFFYVRSKTSIDGLPFGDVLKKNFSIDSYSAVFSNFDKSYHCFYSSENTMIINNVRSDSYFSSSQLKTLMTVVEKVELLKNYCDSEKFIKHQDKFNIVKEDINWTELIDKLVELKVIEVETPEWEKVKDNDSRTIISLEGEKINKINVNQFFMPRYDILHEFNKKKLIELYKKSVGEQSLWLSFTSIFYSNKQDKTIKNNNSYCIIS